MSLILPAAAASAAPAPAAPPSAAFLQLRPPRRLPPLQCAAALRPRRLPAPGHAGLRVHVEHDHHTGRRGRVVQRVQFPIIWVSGPFTLFKLRDTRGLRATRREATDTVDSLKAKIETAAHIPANRQYLRFGDRTVGFGDRTLADYGLEHESLLSVVRHEDWPDFLADERIIEARDLLQSEYEESVESEDSETPAEPAANGHPGGPAPTQAPPPVADGATVRDVGFELRATAGGPYHAGQAGTFGVTLTPGAGYHVNEEYPIRVELTAPAEVTLPKATLARADAADFGPTKAHFEVPFTAAVEGERRVQLTVGFAVCTPERCMPDERTLSVVLPVVP